VWGVGVNFRGWVPPFLCIGPLRDYRGVLLCPGGTRLRNSKWVCYVRPRGGENPLLGYRHKKKGGKLSSEGKAGGGAPPPQTRGENKQHGDPCLVYSVENIYQEGGEKTSGGGWWGGGGGGSAVGVI